MSEKDQRATLEAKDRDELLTIASTLGGKPGSRAKKAEVIDLILGLIADSEPAPPKPRRGRPPKAAVVEEAPVDEEDEEIEEVVAIDDETSSDDDADHADDGDVGDETSGTSANNGASRPSGETDTDSDDGEGGSRRRRRRGRDRGGERFEARTDEPWSGDPVEVSGVLDLRDEGYGFIRVSGYLPTRDDVYVSVKQTRQFSLRRGDVIVGTSRPAARNEKNPALLRIDSVNGGAPDSARERRRFDDLTPLFPDERLTLSSRDEPYNMTTRIIDLLAPIGKGQRGLIVAPPKAGKTTVMKQIAKSISENNPDVHLMVLLVDERPEEVTDMRRSVNGEVVASTFDRPAEEHTSVAELVLERAKRLVEEGRDVVIILDGITRLARAYNLAAPATGRVMSGGIDTGALYPPKKFFGAARNLEEGGSLTIIASALVETGSKMDDVIFEEFKGTGNMELRLDRRLAERRLYPAINVDASSTRHEELLYDAKQLKQVHKLRRVLAGLAEGGSAGPGLEMLIDRLGTFRTNDEFLAEVAKG
ncbi:MAG: transcription termination factor Rho [Actinomycetia bacterium]|nr:transcription termination factor Rho [Actinomycetes bacterium]